jgi:lysophospholipase L1-like esterase
MCPGTAQTIRSAALGVLLLCRAFPLHAQADFYLHDGDRVVFYGDSITDQRRYTVFTETYVVTRFPQMHVTFVHSGWGGDRVSGGGGGPIDRRLERDVFTYKPTVMTIMLGMNDGRYRAFDPAIFDDYANGFKHIIASVKATLPGIRITAIQPSPYDDVTRAPNFPGGYNAVLVRYGQFLQELARSESLDLADLNTSVVAALEKAKGIDAVNAAKIVPDRVHPDFGGHLLMAGALLKAWHAPAVVTNVEIDAATKRIARQDNTEASELEAGKGGLTWTQADRALPMPLDLKNPVMKLSLDASDFVETLNRQMLRVRGLTEGSYGLRIDGESVGIFTGKQFAAGLNLALLPTPMARQAADVHALTLKHNNIHYARWRELQVPLRDDATEHLQSGMDALDTLEGDLVAAQRKAAQPRPHKYELYPVLN